MLLKYLKMWCFHCQGKGKVLHHPQLQDYVWRATIWYTGNLSSCQSGSCQVLSLYLRSWQLCNRYTPYMLKLLPVMMYIVSFAIVCQILRCKKELKYLVSVMSALPSGNHLPWCQMGEESVWFSVSQCGMSVCFLHASIMIAKLSVSKLQLIGKC